MAKIRTVDQLVDTIESDFSWRIREISDIKLAAKEVTGLVQSALTRSATCLLYAHVEGHIENVSTYYIDFLRRQSLNYGELSIGMSLGLVDRYLKRTDRRFLSVTDKIDIVKGVRESIGSKFESFDYSLISAQSNLNSDVLTKICMVIGIDIENFSDHLDFLDKILLKRRNSIAHGSYLEIESQDLEDMSVVVIEIMRIFRNQIENKAVLKGYVS